MNPMDFKITNPLHIFALFLLVITFIFFLLIPVFSFLGFTFFSQTNEIEEATRYYTLLTEVIVLIFQIFLAFFLLVIVPLFWYRIVNKFGFDQIKSKLSLTKNKIDIAVASGIITTISAFICVIIIGVIFIGLGYSLENASNIPDLELYFSIPSLLIIIIIQPIAEEFFFRGFLLEKIASIIGPNTAIAITAVLFGIAHLSYSNLYPAIMTTVVGLLLAFVVVKTRNLYSSIIAHVLYNIISFGTYIIGKSFI